MRASSSTSSSRARARRAVAVLLGTVALGFATVDLALLASEAWRTDATRYVETKTSKIRHMRRRLRVAPDAVLVGTSRALYHLSTRVMADEGWTVHNLGVSGIRLADYPALIEAALAERPRWIVASLTVDALFEPLAAPQPLWPDVVALARSGQPPAHVAVAFVAWLRRLHALHVFRASIYERLALAYRRVEPDAAGRSEPAGRGAPAGRLAALDCEAFDLRPVRGGVRGKCRNGDAVLVGRVGADDLAAIDPGPVVLERPDPGALALLDYLAGRVRASGDTRLALVFEPVLGRELAYSLRDLQQRLALPIVDLTALPLAPALWADARHLNLEGRRRYSRVLARRLRDLEGRPFAAR